MLRKLLLSKIHRAKITQRDPDYIGSITICEDLLIQSGLRPNEAVLVLDIDNAARFERMSFRVNRDLVPLASTVPLPNWSKSAIG